MKILQKNGCRNTLGQCSQSMCREKFLGVSQKISEINYLGKSNFLFFAREMTEIRSETRFYLERTGFGKLIDKKESEFR